MDEYKLTYGTPNPVVIDNLPLSNWTIVNTNTLSINGDTVTQLGVGGWYESMFVSFTVPETGSYKISYDYNITNAKVGNHGTYGFGLWLTTNNPNVSDTAQYNFYNDVSNRTGFVIGVQGETISGKQGTATFNVDLVAGTTYYLWYPGAALDDGTTYTLSFSNIKVYNNPVQYTYSNILTYPGWNGYLMYEDVPSFYNITYTNDGHGTVTGPLTAYGDDVVTLTSTPNQYYTSNGYDVTGGIINGNELTVNGECTVYGKFTLQNSALLYTNNTETVATAINRSFSVSVPTAFPYVAIRFDWYDSHPSVWAYNRNVCGISVRAHYSYSPSLQKVCKPQNNSSAMNAATLYKADGGANIAANSTNAGSYTTVNYAWHNKTTGFSAAVAGTWRYRDARSNNISTLSNITCTNEQTASRYRCTFGCKNVRVACFKNAADCLKTTW